jgi:hypothetical protein
MRDPVRLKQQLRLLSVKWVSWKLEEVNWKLEGAIA